MSIKKHNEDEYERDLFTTVISTALLCKQSTPLFKKIISFIDKFMADKKRDDDKYWNEFIELLDSSLPKNLPELWQQCMIAVAFGMPLEMIQEFLKEEEYSKIQLIRSLKK
jgi:hypothetical protein